MNILHISPRLRPGGVNQLAADLACGLQAVGYRNTVISPPNELVGRITAASVQHHSSHNIAVFTYFSELKRLKRIIRSTQADVILAYTTPAINLAWTACRTLPEDERPAIIGIYTTYPKHPGWAASLEHCDAPVAISKHLRDELTQRADLDAEKNIWVIPYGVNEELCFPAYQPEADWVEQWERTHGKENGTLSVCLAGAITPLHGLEDLPAILTKTNEIKVPVHVYIAGDVARANRRYIDKLKQLFRRRGIDKQVTWLGHRPDLRNILSICDVALSLAKVPACHDRTLLEALSLGKPLAGYDHGYTGEVLDAFLPEGRVNPGDINGIVDRLEQWHAYRPHMQGELPRPFRLGDTIRSISELCSSLRQENPS